MLIIGCDYHPGVQQIAFLDTDTGELRERRLGHREEAEQFYRELRRQNLAVRVGMESSGHARWFELYGPSPSASNCGSSNHTHVRACSQCAAFLSIRLEGILSVNALMRRGVKSHSFTRRNAPRHSPAEFSSRDPALHPDFRVNVSSQISGFCFALYVPSHTFLRTSLFLSIQKKPSPEKSRGA